MLILYAHQLFSQIFGKKVEIKRHEKIENILKETKEEMPAEAEISIFELEEKPEYEINIKIPKSKQNSEDYINIKIEEIKAEELKSFYEKLKKIFEK